MKTILKYPIKIDDSQLISVPKGAKFLSVIEQDDAPILYAIGNHMARIETQVLLRGTGHPIEDAVLETHRFLGTVTTHKGTFVWHVFVERRF